MGVFSPSSRNHYLNVTPSNLLRIYPPGVAVNAPVKLPHHVPVSGGEFGDVQECCPLVHWERTATLASVGRLMTIFKQNRLLCDPVFFAEL